MTIIDHSKLTAQEIADAISGVYEPANSEILKQDDVVNALNSTATNKPLSAAQGKSLNDSKLSNTDTLSDINAELADTDEFPVYDASDTKNRKSAISRLWAYIAAKLESYNGILSGVTLKDYGETLYSPAEITASTLTIDLANGNVQRFTINPSGASTEITLPADPGPLCKSFMLLVTNAAGKAHTWAASPTSRWVGEASAGAPPTPAAATYVTIYSFIWDDVNGGTGRWLGWCSGRDTA